MCADITNEEVQGTFGLCSNTAGPDEVNAQLIDKADRELMSSCLKTMWNKVWTEGRLPPDWKLEQRCVIPKPGKNNYHECCAYRTVSVTDILGKRLEKIDMRSRQKWF